MLEQEFLAVEHRPQHVLPRAANLLLVVARGGDLAVGAEPGALSLALQRRHEDGTVQQLGVRAREAVADLKTALETIMPCFRPGGASWLNALLGKRVDKILFAATKADHLPVSQHDELKRLLTSLLKDAQNRASFAGARTSVMALAGLLSVAMRNMDVALAFALVMVLFYFLTLMAHAER